MYLRPPMSLFVTKLGTSLLLEPSDAIFEWPLKHFEGTPIDVLALLNGYEWLLKFESATINNLV